MMNLNFTMLNLLNNSTINNVVIDTTTIFNNINNNNNDNNFDDDDDILVNNITDYFGPIRDPLYIVIPITIIYMIIFLTGIIGNISTCIVISKNKSMHTATNYYLFSLAISDFLLLVSGVPQEVHYIWSRYPYIFGEMFCILRGLTAETSANATVLTITAFTIERYVAICHPFLSHTMSKLSRAIRLIVLVWFISIAFAIPQALQFGIIVNRGIEQCVVKRIIIQHSFELSTFLFFFAPMTLITVLYVLIGLKLRSSSMLKCENGGTFRRRSYVNSCRQQNNQGTRRVLKMLVAVVVAFFLCWAPFHLQRLFAIYGTSDHLLTNKFMLHIYSILTYISGILYYLSTCINPLLYNIMSNKFREAFKTTLVTCCHIQKRGHDKKRCYRVLSRGNRRYIGRQESTECSGNSVRDESLLSSSTQKQSLESFSSTHKKVYQKTIITNVDIYNVDELPITRNEHLIKTTNNQETKNFHFSSQGNIDDENISGHPILLKIYSKQEKRNIVNNKLTDNIDVENCAIHDINKIITIVPTTKNVCNNLQEHLNKYGDLEISYTNNMNDKRITLKEKFLNMFNNKENNNDNDDDDDDNDIKKIHNIIKNGPIYNLPQQIHLVHVPILSNSSDDGIISDNSLKDIDNDELTDELNSYMEEIKQREKR